MGARCMVHESRSVVIFEWDAFYLQFILIVDWKLEKVLQLDLHQGKLQS